MIREREAQLERPRFGEDHVKGGRLKILEFVHIKKTGNALGGISPAECRLLDLRHQETANIVGVRFARASKIDQRDLPLLHHIIEAQQFLAGWRRGPSEQRKQRGRIHKLPHARQDRKRRVRGVLGKDVLPIVDSALVLYPREDVFTIGRELDEIVDVEE